ncbi:MAG: helix-turn-helix domain-containing protein [bacterium]|nr:helix-turn-helix domain-containing protein [bacterium]
MESIGNCLRAAREEQKIPIAQVVRDTKISEKYIAALEEGDLSRLPAAAYTKGFIRMYAEYLGLDPQPLLDRYAGEAAPSARQALQVEGPPPPPFPWRQSAIGLGTAAVVIAAALAFVGTWRSCEDRRERRLSIGTEEMETLPIPTLPTALPEGPPGGEPAAALEEPPARRTLGAQARENVWMKVYTDGELRFQGTIRKGKEESWTAAETFDVRVGNPRAVDLSLDGKPVRDAGSREAQNIAVDRDGKMTFYKGKMRVE